MKIFASFPFFFPFTYPLCFLSFKCSLFSLTFFSLRVCHLSEPSVEYRRCHHVLGISRGRSHYSKVPFRSRKPGRSSCAIWFFSLLFFFVFINLPFFDHSNERT